MLRITCGLSVELREPDGSEFFGRLASSGRERKNRPNYCKEYLQAGCELRNQWRLDFGRVANKREEYKAVPQISSPGQPQRLKSDPFYPSVFFLFPTPQTNFTLPTRHI